MNVRDHASAAWARTRTATPASALTHHQRRRRAALARDLAVLLGIPSSDVIVTDDPQRSYGGMPAELITARDPDDPTLVLRFIPEPGTTGTGGDIYLLLGPCPGCACDSDSPEVPLAAIADLADLGRYLATARSPDAGAPPADVSGEAPADPMEVPVEFYGDANHAHDCPHS